MHLSSLLSALLFALLTLTSPASAQFNFFDNFFQQGGQQFQQQQQQPQEAPSDSEWYGRVWLDTLCFKYLCPGTLACVDKPDHCPCAHPKVEDKVELGGGKSVCASKGGFKAKEMERKVELARKGIL